MSEAFVHRTADVDPSANIGEGTKIWNNVQIREGAIIGRDCIVGKSVYIDHTVVVGDRVKIQNGVSIYHGVTVEDDVFLGPHMTFTNDLYPRAFDPEWHVVPTVVRRGASVGANVTIVCGVELGTYSMVGAGAVVTRDVPPHARVIGNPARLAGFVSVKGRLVKELSREGGEVIVRVVFLGSQEIGADCLEKVLAAGHDVVGVGLFKPGEHERWTDDVTRIVEERRLPVIRGRRFRTAAALDELRALRPDILFAIGWRWILPASVLAVPPRGCLGIHGSLLPRLRGFAPVNWALIRDEPRTGPTLFYFDDGMDTGDIVGQRPFPITDEDDAATVRERIRHESARLLEEHLPGLAAGTAPRLRQPAEGATYGEQRRPDDGAIDWTRSSREIFNWVRGLTRPYPGAFSSAGGRRVHVWKVRPVEGAGPGAGRVGGEAGRLIAGSADGAVEILDATLPDAPDAGLEDVAAVLRRAGRFD